METCEGCKWDDRYHECALLDDRSCYEAKDSDPVRVIGDHDAPSAQPGDDSHGDSVKR